MPFDWERVSRDDQWYQACLVASVGVGALAGGIVGAAAGGVATPATIPAGMAWGFAAGFLACPYLAPRLKQKMLNGNEFTGVEVKQATEAMSNYSGVKNVRDALKLVAVSRRAAPDSTNSIRSANPAQAAQQILRLV